MQTSIHGVTVASEVIQLAIAPVFLLMGVSALLGGAHWSSGLVSILFIVAMASLISGLACFIREISLSKHVFQQIKHKIVS